MRYKGTPKVSHGGKVYLGFRRSLDTSVRPDDVYYEATLTDTLQTIAYRHLGDVKLWWIVGEFNEIVNPFEEIEPGTRIRLPSRTRLWMEILD